MKMTKQANEPTILSLEDTISCLERKYGKDWKKDDLAMLMLIYSSTNFIKDHFDDIWEKHDLPRKKEAEEYREKGTINGKSFPAGFSMAVLDMIFPECQMERIIESMTDVSRFGASPVRRERRKMTKQAIDDFFKQIDQIQKYWCNITDDKEKIAHGVIFSFLTMLDGCSASFPHECDLLINGISIYEKIGMLHDKLQ